MRAAAMLAKRNLLPCAWSADKMARFAAVCRNIGPGMWNGHLCERLPMMWGKSQGTWQFQLDLQCPTDVIRSQKQCPVPAYYAKELCLAYVEAVRPVIGEHPCSGSRPSCTESLSHHAPCSLCSQLCLGRCAEHALQAEADSLA